MNLYFDAFLSIAPVAVLIFLMVKRNPWPSWKALPFCAGLLYLLKLGYFSSSPNETNATVLTGLLTALTPIMIIWGAILLFTIMERSGCLDVIRSWLNNVTPNRVAQLMIIGWAFSFMIEGASGFGTPAALAAPLLVGLGFEPIKVAVLCLIMNSVPVSFGAVGTPTWFGFGQLGLSEGEIAAIGWKTALMHGAAALVIPVLALRFVVPWQEVRRNLVYVYLSILSCVIPYILIALYSYEFPALAAGFIGFILSILIARMGWGLHVSGDEAPTGWKEGMAHGPAALLRALFPLWGSVLLLVVTRIGDLGIKGFLNDSTPRVRWDIGTLGDLAASASGVISLNNIFGSGLSWSFKSLYIPAIIPFLIIALLTALWCRMRPRAAWDSARTSTGMMKKPVISLGGALVLVTLLMAGGNSSCAHIIGEAAAELAGGAWFYCAPYLGALGSFFAGSNTVSNLTFGGIQQSVAQTLGLDLTTILALQSVGGAMGNMVCINNIVAVGSILGLMSVAGYEGRVIKSTFLPMVLYGIIALLVALLLPAG